MTKRRGANIFFIPALKAINEKQATISDNIFEADEAEEDFQLRNELEKEIDRISNLELIEEKHACYAPSWSPYYEMSLPRVVTRKTHNNKVNIQSKPAPVKTNSKSKTLLMSSCSYLRNTAKIKKRAKPFPTENKLALTILYFLMSCLFP